MNFTRGTIIHHKVIGKGIVLNELEENGEKKMEVRMENGHIEKFYPEELETDEEVQARDRRMVEEIVRSNEERAKKWSY